MSSKDGNSGAKRLVPALAITLSLILPQGLVLADSTSNTNIDTTKQLLKQVSGDTTPLDSKLINTSDPSLVKITQEEAIEKVKSLFPVLKNTKSQLSSIELGVNNSYPAPRNQMVWTMNWSYSEKNVTYGFSSSVDAITGDLIQGYIHNIYQNDEFYPPKLNREEALNKAKQLIVKAVSSIELDDLHLNHTGSNFDDSLFGPMKYGFTFDVYKNGVPSDVQYIRLSISSNGDLLDFSRPSDHFYYPSATPKITLEEAKKKQNGKLNVQLKYVPVFGSNKVNNWVLAWGLDRNTALNSIDANSGRSLDNEGNVVSDQGITYASIDKGKTIFQPRKSSVELTGEEAANIVKKILKVPDDRTLMTQSVRNDYWNKDRKVWSLTWQSPDQTSLGALPDRTTAEVDVLTGEIINYYYQEFPTIGLGVAAPDMNKKDVTVQLSEEALKNKAIEWIQLLYNDASTNLKLVNRNSIHSTKNEKEFTYSFERFYNDIVVEGNAASLVLDDQGNVVSYNSNHYNLSKMPKNPQIKISKEKAQEIYSSLVQQQLQYKNFGSQIVNGTYSEPDIRLVYTTEFKDKQKNNTVLDAITGQWTKVYEELSVNHEDLTQVDDIKGHWAEKQLKILLAYNLLDIKDGKVKPNEVLTQGQWLSIIAKAVNPYYQSYGSIINNQSQEIAGISPEHEYYALASFALERQWISDKEVLHLNEALTREKLAVQLSSILKYNKIAKFMEKDAAIAKLRDVSQINHRGEVALVMKLGLLKPTNGRFNGKDKVTRAEAAAVIMRMVELQGKIDSKLTDR
ncbi:YcdB/YcdC domain-containing protein [Paenibacillus turicensis]|uniref:YcdB/YcdC domain-containing protein n=1 Tax=Paenibacillus turicensis TaxID=160487 RepID=UPI003D2DF580